MDWTGSVSSVLVKRGPVKLGLVKGQLVKCGLVKTGTRKTRTSRSIFGAIQKMKWIVLLVTTSK